MRTIQDGAGQVWDVALGRESYGTHLLIFSTRLGGESRRYVLRAQTQAEAQVELTGLSDIELTNCLFHAEPWGP